jgi:hypothetical protein
LRGKPRLVAFSTGAWGLVVSAVLAIGSRDWLLEEWYLHKLMTGSLKDMEAAAGKLGKMKSSRTLPSLLRGMWDACGEAKESSGARGSFCQAAIIRIGAPAMVYLIDSLDDRNPEFSLWAARTLEDIYLERPPSPKMRAPAQKGYDVKNFQKVTLQLLYHDEALGDGVRQAALEALKKL